MLDGKQLQEIQGCSTPAVVAFLAHPLVDSIADLELNIGLNQVDVDCISISCAFALINSYFTSSRHWLPKIKTGMLLRWCGRAFSASSAAMLDPVLAFPECSGSAPHPHPVQTRQMSLTNKPKFCGLILGDITVESSFVARKRRSSANECT